MERSTEMPSMETIPETLLERDQWLCWRAEDRNGKVTKVPIGPASGRVAPATVPKTWTSFETARDALESGTGTGLGFAFREDGPLVGVDLDDCRNPEAGTLIDWATEIVNTLDSYTEVSPSGEGVHVLVRGSLPPGRNRRGDVEIYDANRFFTVSGRHVKGTPTSVQERSAPLSDVYNAFVDTAPDTTAEDSAETDEQPQSGGTDGSVRGTSTANTAERTRLSDAELLSRARNAANGAKFDRLWRGDTSGYESHSEADMALCSLLAFWTGGDRSRVDELFRRSDLYREKWDKVHYADGRTYGAVTVKRAVDGTDEVYEPATGDASEWIGQRPETNRVRATSDAAADHGQVRGGDGEVARLREQVAHLTRELRERDDEVAQLREALREQEHPPCSTRSSSSDESVSLIERIHNRLQRVIAN